MGITNFVIEDIVSDILSSFTSAFTHIGIGNNDATPLESDTTLSNETYRDALFDTLSSSTFSVSGAIFLDSTENNGNSIKECGVFNASSGGVMLTHDLTNIINKTSSIEAFIEIVIKLIVKGG